jgi:thiopeptide-type bacteriocin biosynthesis protein
MLVSFIAPEVVMVRAPLAPLNHPLPADGHIVEAARNDALLTEAVTLASPDLAAALARLTEDAQHDADGRVAVGLAGYAARIASRATPFGLFAGVGTATIGPPQGRLGRAHRTRTVPDRAWLAALVASLSQAAPVIADLRVSAHPLVRERGDRLLVDHCDHTTDPRGQGELREVSVRRTPMVNMIMANAGAGTTLTTLISGVRPNDRDRLTKVFTALVSAGFLLTELDQLGDEPDPLEQIQRVLRRTEPAAAEQVTAVRAAASTYDLKPAGAGLEALTTLRNRMRAIVDCAHQVCVDTALDAQVTIPTQVVAEAAKIAGAMWRLTGDQTPTHLAGYRDRFVDRYGLDRAVSVLDLLDDHIGLGYPDGYLSDEERAGLPEPGWEAKLMSLWANAVTEGAGEVVLDEATVDALADGRNPASGPPASCDMLVQLAAANVQALAAGQFTLVRPGFSNAAAAATFSRFVDILGPDEGRRLQRMAAGDRPVVPDAEFVELRFRPLHSRSRNVMRAPGWLPRRLCVDVLPSSATDLSVRDVAISCDGTRLYPHTRDGHLLVPISHSVLHPRFAPGVARFLLELGSWLCPRPRAWSWGRLAASAPFLPRLRYRRSILAPASWLLPTAVTEHASNAQRWRAALRQWRTTATAPRMVVAGAGDLRIRLDLDRASDVELLRREHRLHQVRRVEEHAPAADGWLDGPNGAHLAELVIPLVPKRSTASPSGRRVIAKPVRDTPDGVHLPGEDRWLYATLAIPQRSQNLVLATVHRDLALGPGSWFFVRYRDAAGRPTLRLRFRVVSRAGKLDLFERLAATVATLRADRLCDLLSFDTYDPEQERYGGPAALPAAERLFCADTDAVIGTLAADGLDVMVAAALGAVDLIDALSGTASTTSEVLLRTVRGHAGPQRAEVRRSVVDDCHRDDTLGLVARAWTQRAAAAARYGEMIDKLSPQHHLHVVRSVLHMHVNRLLGTDRELEAAALRLARDAIAYRTAMARAAPSPQPAATR